MAEPNPGLRESREDYRPSRSVLFWSSALCIAATMIVGFAWGGWVAGSTATELAQRTAEGAGAKPVAAACVLQLSGKPVHGAQLASSNKADRWDRADLITKGGWAMRPGMQQPPTAAAKLCAQQIPR